MEVYDNSLAFIRDIFETIMIKIIKSVFRAYRPKLCRNCALPQNFHTMKLGKITVFFTVKHAICSLLILQNVTRHFMTFVNTNGADVTPK